MTPASSHSPRAIHRYLDSVRAGRNSTAVGQPIGFAAAKEVFSFARMAHGFPFLGSLVPPDGPCSFTSLLGPLASREQKASSSQLAPMRRRYPWTFFLSLRANPRRSWPNTRV